jgi:hypothetical protein
MPRPSDRTAATVSPGFFSSDRTAERTSEVNVDTGVLLNRG